PFPFVGGVISFERLADAIECPGLGLEKRLKINWNRNASGGHNIFKQQVLRIQHVRKTEERTCLAIVSFYFRLRIARFLLDPFGPAIVAAVNRERKSERSRITFGGQPLVDGWQ